MTSATEMVPDQSVGWVSPYAYRDDRGLWYTLTGAKKKHGVHDALVLRWAKTPCRYLGGRYIESRRAPHCPLPGAQPKVLYFGPDLEEIQKRQAARYKNVLPEANGAWLGDHIFQTSDKTICFDFSYLKANYSGVCCALWRQWLKRPNLDLGRTLRAYKAPGGPSSVRGHPGGAKRARIVWVQEDVEAAARRWTDHKARRMPPAYPGSWLSEALWQDKEFGVCARDSYISEHIGRGHSQITNLRRRPHPALDPAVNSGRPRCRRVPSMNGRGLSHVSCLEDIDKIAAWNRERERQLVSQAVPVGWKHRAQLAQALCLTGTEARLDLRFALLAFRTEHPNSAVEGARKQRVKNSLFRVWYYDPESFKCWLGARSIKEAAAAFKPPSGRRAQARLDRAVRFLQFVLTSGKFTRRTFGRFLAEPPTAPLQPCAPVPSTDLYAWARVDGIGVTLLRKARGMAGAKRFRKGYPLQAYWYLPSPVLPPNPITSAAEKNGEARDKKRGQGRPRTKLATDLGRFCYEQLAAGTLRRKTIRDMVATKFKRPLFAEADVTIYARRYAEAEGNPWPV
jgi:hypothetical protein